MLTENEIEKDGESPVDKLFRSLGIKSQAANATDLVPEFHKIDGESVSENVSPADKLLKYLGVLSSEKKQWGKCM